MEIFNKVNAIVEYYMNSTLSLMQCILILEPNANIEIGFRR